MFFPTIFKVKIYNCRILFHEAIKISAELVVGTEVLSYLIYFTFQTGPCFLSCDYSTSVSHPARYTDVNQSNQHTSEDNLSICIEEGEDDTDTKKS